MHLLTGLDHLVVQDIFLTKTAELADVVLPGSASWCESEGTVTNSERRVQRCRKALDPPPGARDDIQIILDICRRLGHEWGYGTEPLEVAERVWNEVRSLSPMHAGMSYARLEELQRHPVALPARGLARAVVPPRSPVGRRPRRSRSPRSVQPRDRRSAG